ncbi:MAG: hypothetical protein ABI426_12075 [Flavobacterium sp.]
MKKSIISIFLLISVFANGQKREFKNQGEQENYWPQQFFKKNYSLQKYEKFKGEISVVNQTTVTFDNKTLEIWNIKPELLQIFNEGLFYPQILIGYEENNPVKTKEEVDCFSDEERFRYNYSRNDSLRISNFKEAPFLSNSSKTKRFTFWYYRKGSMNPQVYYIELINEEATKKTDLEDFIKGAELTFVNAGGIII